jgi:hypothetical protein
VEPEGSLPPSQESTSGLNPEPDESTPHLPFLFLYVHPLYRDFNSAASILLMKSFFMIQFSFPYKRAGVTLASLSP